MSAYLLGLFRLFWLAGKGHPAIVLGEPCSPPAVGYLQAQEKASTPSRQGPLVLDRVGRGLEGLAASPVRRSPRHGRALAATTLSPLLGATVQPGWKDGPAADQSRHPQVDKDDSPRESVVARTPDS